MASRILNILTVDDEAPVTCSIQYALGGPAWLLAAAGDGEDALAQIQAHEPPFDLVITDNNMPRLSGLELVRRLREISFGGKIIVLSAHLSAEVQGAYRALNVDRMIPKPFNVRELRSVVQEVSSGSVAIETDE
jgi:two-component system chemotaxis response regulator CheY